MSGSAPVLAVGLVDADGVWGSGGIAATWADLDVDPPGTGRTFRTLFGRRDQTFRRLDRVSRAFVLAAEATGLHERTDLQREDVSVIVETGIGVLDTDIEFARQLANDVVDGPLFPYSLPSACVGEVALRHGLRGESLCFTASDGGPGVAWREAAAILESGEARQVLVGYVDVLTESYRECEPILFAVAALIGPGGRPLPRDCENPFAALAEWAREGASGVS